MEREKRGGEARYSVAGSVTGQTSSLRCRGCPWQEYSGYRVAMATRGVLVLVCKPAINLLGWGYLYIKK